jgi:hypothetical protein
MSLTESERQAKLRKLCEIEGYETVEALIEAVLLDAVSPAICASPECNYTCEMEPDQYPSGEGRRPASWTGEHRRSWLRIWRSD